MLLRPGLSKFLNIHLPKQHPRIPHRSLTVASRSHLCSHRALAVASCRQLSTLNLKTSSWVSLNDRRMRRYSTIEPFVVKSHFKDIPIPRVGITDFFWERMGEWPDKTAMLCGITGRSYTFTELRDMCRRFAVSLQSAGYKPGDIVAIVMPNTLEYPVVMLGSFEAGLVVTTVNPAYTPDEISKQLLDSEPTIVVSCPENYTQVLEATRLAGQQGYKKPRIIVAPSIESSEVPEGATPLARMIGPDVDVSSFIPVKVDPTSVACIPYSSGTTGLPKGVCLSHINLIANAVEVSATNLLAAATDEKQEVVIAVLPFFHIYGIASLIISKLYLGLQLVTLPKFDPGTFLNALYKYKVTILMLVPPLVLFLASNPAVTKEHLRYVTFVGSAAAPLAGKDVERFLQKAPQAMFLQGYGLTELSVMMLGTHHSVKYSSVGRVLANNQMKIINAEGESLGPGQVGEVCGKGPQVMLGYYKQPEATAAMIDKDGWLHSGDLGYYDEERYVYIVDRLKELIKVKGFQVAPAELEGIIRTHPQVIDAAVIGIPDDRSGEVPLAYVIPNPNAALDTFEADVKKFVADKVADYKQLEGGVRIVKSIPKTPAGKILRRLLREEYLKA